MSYTKYTTQACILRITPQGESNFDVVFLTTDFGKITVRAQSARENRSTMRMYLIRYRFVTISIVRGKNLWRLVGITDLDEFMPRPQRVTQTPFPKTLRLVEQLVTGESEQLELFEFIKKYAFFLSHISEQAVFEGAEIIGTISLLILLGYWDHDHNVLLTPDTCKNVLKNKQEYIKKINKALEISHLQHRL